MKPAADIAAVLAVASLALALAQCGLVAFAIVRVRRAEATLHRLAAELPGEVTIRSQVQEILAEEGPFLNRGRIADHQMLLAALKDTVRRDVEDEVRTALAARLEPPQALRAPGREARRAA